MAGVRVLVVGATGMIGGLAARMLYERGASMALAGRNAGRLADRSRLLGDCPRRVFDAYDLEGCAALAPWAARSLGGLDCVVVAIGVAGFGRAEHVDEAAAEHLMTVNALAPMAVVRGALPVLESGRSVGVVTGAVVDAPPQGTADYAAAKSALAAWLGVVGREQRRRGVRVVDVRMPHLEGGFADRAVTGRAPTLPPGADPGLSVERYLVEPLADAARRSP
ncbi:SDR family NAD(P)-dependent oxidoreductase [Streptomyces sp. NK15101]|uniref:SDR family NAD(P)-dependent oxidoreductase n=1 Tax=Streptomyces sp. NK15101 TaxID=2873261 RepID=UPI001CECED70|nr:SDR family NAD(P)-dependent oxidoreductase [Streptomyces sp. NK15101]